MVQDIYNLFRELFMLALLAGTAFYAGLVVVSYRTVSPKTLPRENWRDPVHFAEEWAIWLGVFALSVMVRVGAPVFGMLSEASADVGEWVLARRRPES